MYWYCTANKLLENYGFLQRFSIYTKTIFGSLLRLGTFIPSVAEPHHFYVAPDPGKNFDAAPAAPAAPAPAPTLLYSKAKFLKRTKV
jgi:hypothetical protein